jgi:hypothetical protein
VEINIIVKRPAGKLRKELDYAVEIYSWEILKWGNGKENL